MLPGVHRLFSLAKRWLEGTHQGGIDADHLQSYLDEFIFRFNRRTARKRGLLFLRLLERAVEADPIRYADIVANPKKTGRQGTRPGRREWPGTLAVAPLDRPWRTAGQPARRTAPIWIPLLNNRCRRCGRGGRLQRSDGLAP